MKIIAGESTPGQIMVISDRHIARASFGRHPETCSIRPLSWPLRFVIDHPHWADTRHRQTRRARR